jgi:chemotaxis protein histidine kinase CheA
VQVEQQPQQEEVQEEVHVEQQPQQEEVQVEQQPQQEEVQEEVQVEQQPQQEEVQVEQQPQQEEVQEELQQPSLEEATAPPAQACAPPPPSLEATTSAAKAATNRQQQEQAKSQPRRRLVVSASLEPDSLNKAEKIISSIPSKLNFSEFEVAAVAFHNNTLFLQRRGMQPMQHNGGVMYDGKVSVIQKVPDGESVEVSLFGRAVTTRAGEGQEDDALVLIGVWVKKPSAHMAWLMHLPTGVVYKGKLACHPTLQVGSGSVMRSAIGRGDSNGEVLQRLLQTRETVIKMEAEIKEASTLRKRQRPKKPTPLKSKKQPSIVFDDIDEFELDRLVDGLSDKVRCCRLQHTI